MVGIGETEIVLIHSVSAIASAVVACKKGRNPVPFAILGLILSLIGVVVTLVMPSRKVTKIQEESLRAQTLADYKKLLDDGALTQEEYDKKKAELLG